jgi:hypothetical protein
MRDAQVIRYRKSSEACAVRTNVRGGNAREWSRLAKCWELLAQTREVMPSISDEAAVPEMPEGVAKDYDGSAM